MNPTIKIATAETRWKTMDSEKVVSKSFSQRYFKSVQTNKEVRESIAKEFAKPGLKESIKKMGDAEKLKYVKGLPADLQKVLGYATPFTRESKKIYIFTERINLIIDTCANNQDAAPYTKTVGWNQWMGHVGMNLETANHNLYVGVMPKYAVSGNFEKAPLDLETDYYTDSIRNNRDTSELTEVCQLKQKALNQVTNLLHTLPTKDFNQLTTNCLEQLAANSNDSSGHAVSLLSKALGTKPIPSNKNELIKSLQTLVAEDFNEIKKNGYDLEMSTDDESVEEINQYVDILEKTVNVLNDKYWNNDYLKHQELFSSFQDVLLEELDKTLDQNIGNEFKKKAHDDLKAILNNFISAKTTNPNMDFTLYCRITNKKLQQQILQLKKADTTGVTRVVRAPFAKFNLPIAGSKSTEKNSKLQYFGIHELGMLKGINTLNSDSADINKKSPHAYFQYYSRYHNCAGGASWFLKNGGAELFISKKLNRFDEFEDSVGLNSINAINISDPKNSLTYLYTMKRGIDKINEKCQFLQEKFEVVPLEDDKFPESHCLVAIKSLSVGLNRLLDQYNLERTRNNGKTTIRQLSLLKKMVSICYYNTEQQVKGYTKDNKHITRFINDLLKEIQIRYASPLYNAS